VRIHARHLEIGIISGKAAQIHERLSDDSRDRLASREEGTDRAGGLAVDAVDPRILGNERRGFLLLHGRVPVGRHRLSCLQHLDMGILREDGFPARDLRCRHRIARRPAEHDDVAFAIQRLNQPFGGLLSDLALAFGNAVDIVLADDAREIVAGFIGHHGDSRLGGFARRFQDQRTAVEERDDHVELLGKQALDVGNLLLRLEFTVGVARLGDVLAFRRLVLELGAGDMAPIVAAKTIGQRDLERLGSRRTWTSAGSRQQCRACPDKDWLW
jgi:hypothetical protein